MRGRRLPIQPLFHRQLCRFLPSVKMLHPPKPMPVRRVIVRIVGTWRQFILGVRNLKLSVGTLPGRPPQQVFFNVGVQGCQGDNRADATLHTVFTLTRIIPVMPMMVVLVHASIDETQCKNAMLVAATCRLCKSSRIASVASNQVGQHTPVYRTDRGHQFWCETGARYRHCYKARGWPRRPVQDGWRG